MTHPEPISAANHDDPAGAGVIPPGDAVRFASVDENAVKGCTGGKHQRKARACSCPDPCHSLSEDEDTGSAQAL